MARISEKDAIRLGLIPPTTLVEDRAKRANKPRIPGPSRQPAKGGRLRRNAAYAPFELVFAVPFEPKTKHRARTHLSKTEIEKAFIKSGGNLGAFRSMLAGIKHRTVTPDNTRAFEETVAVLASSAMRGREGPYPGPVKLEITFVLGGDPEFWPTDVTDPDLDNMEKAISDAMNGIVWKDDRLLVEKTSIKVCQGTPAIRLRVTHADPSATGPV